MSSEFRSETILSIASIDGVVFVYPFFLTMVSATSSPASVRVLSTEAFSGLAINSSTNCMKSSVVPPLPILVTELSPNESRYCSSFANGNISAMSSKESSSEIG